MIYVKLFFIYVILAIWNEINIFIYGTVFMVVMHIHGITWLWWVYGVFVVILILCRFDAYMEACDILGD